MANQNPVSQKKEKNKLLILIIVYFLILYFALSFFIALAAYIFGLGWDPKSVERFNFIKFTLFWPYYVFLEFL